jgi:SOS response regulatory protein OraA/RecX
MTDSPSTPLTQSSPRSAGAARMARSRDRRRKGLRCLTVELRETEVDALIRSGRLSADDRANLNAVRKALYRFLDDNLL